MNPAAILDVLVGFAKFAGPALPGLVGKVHEYAAALQLGTPPDLAAWDGVDAKIDAKLAALEAAEAKADTLPPPASGDRDVWRP